MSSITEIIKYNFKDEELLTVALTHSSYAHKFNLKNNERLEFLGDSVLGLIITEFLVKEYSLKEGELSKVRAKIVSCENLSKVVKNNGLDRFVKTSPQDLVQKETVQGDFFEALLGAMYLDSDLNTCKNFIYNILNITKEHVDKIMNKTNDYKTKLQELVQAKKGSLKYVVIGEEGLDNNKTFEVELFINDISISKAKGKSKQKAENLCAKFAVENINKFV
jgi:ribonuclease-3